MDTFNDNLPLNGEVQQKGDDRVWIYRGFESHNTRRCAVTLDDLPYIVWLDRSSLTPVEKAD